MSDKAMYGKVETSIGSPSDDTPLASVPVTVSYEGKGGVFTHEFSVPFVLVRDSILEFMRTNEMPKSPLLLELVSAVVQEAPR